MSTIILKLGATGDVVRTTALVRAVRGPVTWITSAKNKTFVEGISEEVRALSWEERDQARGSKYDLLINLEDERETALFAKELEAEEVFGAYLDSEGTIRYTPNARRWFDLSLISVHGREAADRLKLANRSTYQDLIFDGLGFEFSGEKYLIPEAEETGLRGDVAIAPEAGTVWPMKRWAYYEELKRALEDSGFRVNVLRTRPTMREHLADVQGHRCLVSGDTLPMHLALGSGIKCVSIFTCTSPWEIYDYGIQIKLISPLLDQYFYKRKFEERATTSIGMSEVLRCVLEQLRTPGPGVRPLQPACCS